MSMNSIATFRDDTFQQVLFSKMRPVDRKKFSQLSTILFNREATATALSNQELPKRVHEIVTCAGEVHAEQLIDDALVKKAFEHFVDAMQVSRWDNQNLRRVSQEAETIAKEAMEKLLCSYYKDSGKKALFSNYLETIAYSVAQDLQIDKDLASKFLEKV